MSSLQIPVSSTAISVIKTGLTKSLPGVKSSHRVEALARACGFLTYAALLAATRSNDLSIASINSHAFVAYLNKHGFKVEETALCLAATPVAINQRLTRPSHKINKDIIVEKAKDRDGKPDGYRNLMIAGINEILATGMISLKPEVNEKNGYLFTKLFGHLSAISWCHISHDEIRVSVWWKYTHENHPQANLTGNSKEQFNGTSPLANRKLYSKFVGVTVSGWLERKKGCYLQGCGRKNLHDIYTRSDEKSFLKFLPHVEPHGYKAEGKFFG